MVPDTFAISESALRAVASGVLSEGAGAGDCCAGRRSGGVCHSGVEQQLAQQQAAAAGHSHQTPATPSGMKPPYQSRPPKSRQKRPGAKPGHMPVRGERLPSGSTITRTIEPSAVPTAAVAQTLRGNPRRYTEDIPDISRKRPSTRSIATGAPSARRRSSRRVPDALPGSQLGNRVLVLVGLVALRLGQHALANRRGLQLPPANQAHPGGLVQMWYRLQAILFAWYEADSARSPAIGRAARRRKRLAGKRQNPLAVVLCTTRFDLLHDRPVARLSGALKFFIEEFSGTLVSDFWGAYNACLLRAAANVPGASAARVGTYRQYKSPGKKVGRRSPRSCGG
jgi:transposase